MDYQQRPQQIFHHQELPDLPPPHSPHDRFPFWRRLIVCVGISTAVTLLIGAQTLGRDRKLAADATNVLIFALLGIGAGIIGGLIWIGADYLEFRNQRGLKTSSLFAHFFCMGVSSVMLWGIILCPLIFVAAVVLAIMGIF